MRVIFFHGIAPGDPFTYSSSAWSIVQGQWNPGYFYEQTTRWSVLFPLAAGYKLFGVNDGSSALWPLLTSLGTVVIAYLLALHLKGERAALWAGFLVATFPLEIIYATQPMADCPLSFWLLLSLYCFVRGEDTTTNKQWFFFFSGIALALAYATKFVAILIAPFFLFVLLWRRRMEWNWLWLGVGSLLVFALEFFIFQQVTGNGLARLDLILHDQASHAPVTAGGFQVQNAVWLYLYWMFVDFHYVGLSFVLLLLMLLHRVIQSRLDRNHGEHGGHGEPTVDGGILFPVRSVVNQYGLLLLWSFTFWLILSFYPVSTKPYVPLYKVEPYILMFSAPLLVVTAVFLSEYAKRVQIAALALILLSTLPFVYVLHEGYRAHGDNARAIWAFAKAHTDRPLYAHRSDQRFLQYFDGFARNDAYRNFRLPKPDEDVHATPPINFQHTYVAVNQYLLTYHREDSYPSEITNPPPHWREVYRYQRPEHCLRRVVAAVTKPLPANVAQTINRKFANWSHTQPVIIYSVD
ncbi:MAG TPA: phospholipid carrier-dependent glycosyltransferase [Blastocatellia bacterium]|nr:phospholipid carrier-dependent glycosyltransferase [Blastocatellia bacterium]